MKTIYFDMDGTIADLYGEKGWLEDLENERVAPFLLAKPLLNMWKLSVMLKLLQRKGYRVGIISWTPREATKTYAARVEKAKRHWLKENLFIYLDEIKIIPYGENKKKNADTLGWLFDDENKNREEWGKGAYEPKEIFNVLESLL